METGINGQSNKAAVSPDELRGALIAAAILSSAAFIPSAALADPVDQRILDVHNSERASNGAPPLRWNAKLASDATAYSQELARTGRRVHSSRQGRGIERENLNQGMLGWNTDQMLGNWLNEKRHFYAGI